MNPDKRCAKQGRRICEVHVPKARLDVDGATRGKSTGGLVGREKFVILPCPTSLLILRRPERRRLVAYQEEERRLYASLGCDSPKRTIHIDSGCTGRFSNAVLCRSYPTETVPDNTEASKCKPLVEKRRRALI